MVAQTSTNKKPCASQKSLSLWRRPLAMQKLPAMMLSHATTPGLGEEIHVEKEQFKAYFLALLVDKEFTMIFDAIPSLKSISHLNALCHTFVYRREVIKGFPLQILESPAIGE